MQRGINEQWTWSWSLNGICVNLVHCPPAVLSARSATGCVVHGLCFLSTSPTYDDETCHIEGSVHTTPITTKVASSDIRIYTNWELLSFTNFSTTTALADQQTRIKHLFEHHHEKQLGCLKYNILAAMSLRRILVDFATLTWNIRWSISWIRLKFCYRVLMVIYLYTKCHYKLSYTAEIGRVGGRYAVQGHSR